MSTDGRPAEVPADRAVVDRIVDGRIAVLLVGPAGTELLVAAEKLPEGAHEGTWVGLDPATEPPTVLGIDDALTERRLEDLAARMEVLRRERRGGRFGEGERTADDGEADDERCDRDQHRDRRAGGT